MIWDAESLIVFKLMFFRRKDVADVEGILASSRADWTWIGSVSSWSNSTAWRNPRVSQWEELVAESEADGGNLRI